MKKLASCDARICAAVVRLAKLADMNAEARAFLNLYEIDKTVTAVVKQEALATILEAIQAKIKSLVPRPVDGTPS